MDFTEEVTRKVNLHDIKAEILSCSPKRRRFLLVVPYKVTFFPIFEMIIFINSKKNYLRKKGHVFCYMT